MEWSSACPRQTNCTPNPPRVQRTVAEALVSGHRGNGGEIFLRLGHDREGCLDVLTPLECFVPRHSQAVGLPSWAGDQLGWPSWVSPESGEPKAGTLALRLSDVGHTVAGPLR